MTRSAEALIKNDAQLKIRDGKLRCENREETDKLERAIKSVCAEVKPATLAPLSVIVRGRSGMPIVADVIPLARRAYALGFNARAIVVVGGQKASRPRALEIVQTAFGLTRSEAAVALALAEGHSPEEVAEARTASLSTVRTQVRSIHFKVGVRRQGELISRLRRLLYH